MKKALNNKSNNVSTYVAESSLAMCAKWEEEKEQMKKKRKNIANKLWTSKPLTQHYITLYALLSFVWIHGDIYFILIN